MPSYAEIRKRERKHIESSLKDDKKLKRKISKVYRSSSDDIQRNIEADIQFLASSEGVSMATAKETIKKTDVEAMQHKIEKLMKDSETSPKARRELRRYNVTLRTNRLELIQARINLNTVELAIENEALIGKKISDDVIREYKRQAGILMLSVPSTKKLDKLAKSILASDVSGASFSDRIWADQNELRESINTAIERALIRGEHPRNAIADIKRHIRGNIDKKQYSAHRIAVTETARAQSISMEHALKDAEIEEYIFIAEDTACDECSELDNKVFNVKDMKPGVNAHPIHPFVVAPLLLM